MRSTPASGTKQRFRTNTIYSRATPGARWKGTAIAGRVNPKGVNEPGTAISNNPELNDFTLASPC